MKTKLYPGIAIRRLCTMATLAITLIICPRTSNGQQTPVVTARAELETKLVTVRGEKLSFADALTQVSKQLGRSVIADDQPHLQSADLDLHSNAKQALDRIADIFDYTWTVSKKGVILLTKRFKNQLEYPQVDLPELRAAVRDVFTALRVVPYDTEINRNVDCYNQIYQEFTPEQKALLKTGVPQSGAMLTTHQAQLLNESALNTHFAGTIALWKALSTQLKWMPRSFFQLRNFPDFYVRRGDLHAPLQEGIPIGRELGYITVIDGQENVMRLNWFPAKSTKKGMDDRKGEVKKSEGKTIAK